jgi:hypothetical protein
MMNALKAIVGITAVLTASIPVLSAAFGNVAGSDVMTLVATSGASGALLLCDVAFGEVAS